MKAQMKQKNTVWQLEFIIIIHGHLPLHRTMSSGCCSSGQLEVGGGNYIILLNMQFVGSNLKSMLHVGSGKFSAEQLAVCNLIPIAS